MAPPFSRAPALFPFRHPVSPINAPAVPHPPEPPCPAAAPDSHLPPGTLSIHSWHCDATPLPCAHNLGQELPGSSPWGPPELAPPGHRCWGAAGVSEGTARLPQGQQLLAPPNTLSLGCWGVGGRSLWGHCEAGPGHPAWQCPDCGGPGSKPLPLKPAPPGAGMTPGGARAAPSGQQPQAGAPRRCPALPPSCPPVRGAPARRGRAYLGWPPPGPGTWSPRRRFPPGSSEPPAAARCSAAAAGHGAGRPPGAGPRAGAARAAPSRGAGERGPPASPPARPRSTLPPPPSRAEPPPSGLRAACARRSVCVYEAVCMCVCERVCERARGTAGAARPPPNAATTAAACARCRPRAALHLRSPPPRGHGRRPGLRLPAAPAGRAAEPHGPACPVSGSGSAARPTPGPCFPDGRVLAPGRAAEPATSSEVPFGFDPKGV